MAACKSVKKIEIYDTTEIGKMEKKERGDERARPR